MKVLWDMIDCMKNKTMVLNPPCPCYLMFIDSIKRVKLCLYKQTSWVLKNSEFFSASLRARSLEWYAFWEHIGTKMTRSQF